MRTYLALCVQESEVKAEHRPTPTLKFFMTFVDESKLPHFRKKAPYTR